MNSLPASYGPDAGDDVDMKPFASAALQASTVDSSLLVHGFGMQTEQFPSEYVSPALLQTASKGKTAKKKTKGEEADDGRSQADEEEIDVDRYVNMDSAQVSVKILRKLIPKLRIACYFSDEQMSGKRKFKHLWDERPGDWPEHIPFKDPNNANKDVSSHGRQEQRSGRHEQSCQMFYSQDQVVRDPTASAVPLLAASQTVVMKPTGARKPGKDELGPMFTFLKTKYLDQKPNRGRPAADSEHVHSSNIMSSDAFAARVPDGSHAMSVQPTDNQLIFSQEDSKLWQWQHFHRQQQQQNVAQFSDEHAVLVPTRTEQLPRDVQQSMITAALVQQHVPVTVIAADRKEVMLPAPVRDIYQRLADKQQQVTSMSGDSDDVLHLLNKVQREVIGELYKNLSTSSESNTKLCLMFIDFAHQYEAMLDVLIILGRIDVTFLRNGCDELIEKFNKECVSVNVMQSCFHLPNLLGSRAFTSMILRGLPVAAEKQQCDSGGRWTAVQNESEFTKCSHRDQAGSPSADDVALFGINLKDGGQHQHRMSTLIEKRSPEMLPTVLDNDKMNIDDEAMTKLLEQLCQQHSDQQPMKICSGLSEQPETVTSMDCTASEILSDVVEIISNDFGSGQSPQLDLRVEDDSSRLTVEPFSFSSNTESLPYIGGGGSGQWSLRASVDSSWSSSTGMSLTCQPAAFTSTDQHFTLNQTQYDSHEFRSLPNNVVTDSYNVQAGQVEPSSLSLLLPSNQTLVSPADGVIWYAEQQWNQQPASASVCSAVEHVAPIPAFVSNASYDDFEMDETKQRGSRGTRSKRGSVCSARTGKTVDRNGKKT